MNLCMFCGGGPLTREHIIAERLTKRMQRTTLAVVSAKSTDSGKEGRPPILLHSLVLKHVCGTCNHGWMNDLEDWVETKLGGLIEPGWPKTPEPLITAIAPETTKLAHWLLKTAATFDRTSLLSSKIFSDEICRVMKRGNIPAETQIHLAFAQKPELACALSRSFQTVNGNVHHSMQVHTGNGFRFSIQMNHLLLRILCTPGAVPTFVSPLEPHLPICMYPRFARTSYGYRYIFAFEVCLVLKTEAP
jgi:hypothetical protein